MDLHVAWLKLVGIMNKRKYSCPNDNYWFGGNKMKQARVLSEKELNLLLLYIATRKYAARDRAMVLMTFWGGMRIGETVSTTILNVLNVDGTIKQELHLTAEQTKGRFGRTVVLSEKLRKELQCYLQQRFNTKDLATVAYTEDMSKALFATQKRQDKGFSPNTGAYHLHMLYRAAGLDGCSSHSGRRFFATAISAKGAAIKTIMELMGHRQMATTARYLFVTPDMKKAAVELL